ncbi:MAG: SIS domain-containing protein [Candidatus Marinimicrobia bacterium]|nr:SIS domain-containing protein [Candidatus Neomarinimicrobiota bacterium]
MEFYEKYFRRLGDKLESVSTADLEEVVRLLQETSKAGKKIIIAGNGGSAAMASHVSVDLTKSAGIRSINFNESDLITCFANDYGYEEWIKKSIELYSDPGDSVILISSSGKSRNVINAAELSRKLNLKLITFSGFSPENELRKLGNINFWVDSDEYNVVEMTHHIWLLSIVDRIISEQA